MAAIRFFISVSPHSFVIGNGLHEHRSTSAAYHSKAIQLPILIYDNEKTPRKGEFGIECSFLAPIAYSPQIQADPGRKDAIFGGKIIHTVVFADCGNH